MTLGLYISVPFCRTKCSYCNFASDVFSKAAYEGYVSRVLDDIRKAPQIALELGCALPETVDSIYFGGGTPSILDPGQLARIFNALRQRFSVGSHTEVTVECAPGTLTSAMVDTLLACGVTRVSLGVQSFVDQEAQAVGRLHKRATVLAEIARLRQHGIANINIDLIAGLPHQTAETWTFSLGETIASGVPHVSVYMLEVDEDSRLGRELIAGGTRYHAHFVPDEEATADFYLQACETFNANGIKQYEISNFARRDSESRHNLKYWTRQPYLGFGVDAHSMLVVGAPPSVSAVRFSAADSLDGYMNRAPIAVTQVSERRALEESFFLGLRLNEGVNLAQLSAQFGSEIIAGSEIPIKESIREGLLEECGTGIRLTPRGRLLSNEVFARFLIEEKVDVEPAKA
ncbi:MAG: coproporphyrinogen III oxidase [Acidobacteria bacterium]|jgi:putative oxygen-independent coproporphyrinogen III oxidase|nr:MAG: coproporphyrinogen III oxidase [Acidobacteriota bacterium]